MKIFFLFFSFFFFFGVFSHSSEAAVNKLLSSKNKKKFPFHRFPHLKRDLRSSLNPKKPVRKVYTSPVFDFPMTYNYKVKNWIKYFQTTGSDAFKRWLERSTRYAPYIKRELKNHNLPRDIFYVAMIESGFASKARSSAGAVGLWQFIPSTGRDYGLKINNWLDERRNFKKATRAAIAYKKSLYRMFGSWYLVSASYNMGENKLRRLVEKYKTNNFWKLAKMGILPDETINYVPKIIAATLIAKSPALYGFKNINYKPPYRFEEMFVPGGTDLGNLARYLGVKARYLKDLNPDLLMGFIPREVKGYKIKIPVGSKIQVRQYSRLIAENTI